MRIHGRTNWMAMMSRKLEYISRCGVMIIVLIIIIARKVDHGLVKPYLGLQELHVVNGLLQHGHSVHLGPAGDQALQDLEPVADPVPPLPGSHALRVRRQLHFVLALLIMTISTFLGHLVFVVVAPIYVVGVGVADHRRGRVIRSI